MSRTIYLDVDALARRARNGHTACQFLVAATQSRRAELYQQALTMTAGAEAVVVTRVEDSADSRAVADLVGRVRESRTQQQVIVAVLPPEVYGGPEIAAVSDPTVDIVEQAT